MSKTNIRNKALQWVKFKYPDIEGDIVTSKFYTPAESWSNTRVWFFQIPLSKVEPNKIKYIHLISENHLSGEPFIYLKVPTLFLLKNKNLFEVDNKQKNILIYLSAEAVDMFKEVRKGSKLDFSKYLQ